jgi:hypothetical protein
MEFESKAHVKVIALAQIFSSLSLKASYLPQTIECTNTLLAFKTAESAELILVIAK